MANSQSEKDIALSKLQPVITYATIAVDECDFGTGLELGINLFASGLSELEPSAQSALCSVYPLLKREKFSNIIKVSIYFFQIHTIKVNDLCININGRDISHP